MCRRTMYKIDNIIPMWLRAPKLASGIFLLRPVAKRHRCPENKSLGNIGLAHNS